MKRRSMLVIGLAVACVSQPAAGSVDIEGVRFEEHLSVGERDLRLHGTGLLRYRVFIKGYVAALYLEGSLAGSAAPKDVLADVPRRLEIEYFWSISAADFARATALGVSRNTDPATFEQLGPRIDRINQLYEDVQPGDRYALTYLPGLGTELALNGRPLGRIEGADFAAALFAIWVGDEPIDESLRDQLLSSH